jgi:hypothetical protein
MKIGDALAGVLDAWLRPVDDRPFVRRTAVTVAVPEVPAARAGERAADPPADAATARGEPAAGPADPPGAASSRASSSAAERTPPSATAPTSSRGVDWDALAAEANAVDLVALLERYGHRPVWRAKDGGKATFRVPWRVDRHPSLGVFRRADVWFWVDHARDEAGTPIHAVQRLEGVSRTEAIRRLTRGGPSRRPSRPPSSPPVPGPVVRESHDPDRERKKAQARRLYEQARAAMTPERAEALARYWRAHGVRDVPDLGAVWLTLEADGRSRPYIGIPLPTPARVWALECRLLDGRGPADRLWRARTYGPKELWVCWRRDPTRLLVAESILDALSALTLWPEREDSLLALNGVGNVRLLPAVLQQVARAGRPIRLVRLALDNDAAGREAARQAETFLTPLGVRVVAETAHVEAGVKDLNKLLRERGRKEGP